LALQGNEVEAVEGSMAKKVLTFERTIEPLHIRKARQAIEGPEALKDYAKKADAVLNQMAKLRAERLRREALSKQET
jgi:hypothetical protein